MEGEVAIRMASGVESHDPKLDPVGQRVSRQDGEGLL